MTADLRRIRSDKTKERVTITLGDQTVEELARQVNELIEDKLKAQKDAIQTERQLTEMIASMSHDLRTPLTAIIGYIQLLEEENINSKQHAHYISVVHARATQLHALIQSFFALSTLSETEEPFHLKQVSIDQLVKEYALNYYDAFENSGKSVQLHMPKTPISTVIGDDVVCRRIIENILLNALQHAEKDITIAVQETKESVAFIAKNTVDTAKQLDPERLFERLYTADRARQHHRGLGLPIVEQLMKQMDGHVFIVIDKGTFSITCEWKKVKSAASL